MDKKFTAKFENIMYDEAIEMFKGYAKGEKQFIQLIMVQGMSNVTEVFL